MNIVFRADASREIGTGHVMRCLALAQACQDEGLKAIFSVICLPSMLEQQLRQNRIKVVWQQSAIGSEADAHATLTCAERYAARWVVIDGYRFGSDYQHWLKRAQISVLMLDDYGHASFYEADIVLNQNISAKAEWYKRRSPTTRLLLGSKYSLLRREFYRFKSWERDIPSVADKLLITLGGGDSGNTTYSLIEILDNLTLKNLHVKVIVGAANPCLADLVKVASQSRYTISILTNIKDMSNQMAWADMAVIGGGSTCWEVALLGLPSLIVIVAENQTEIVKELCARNSAILLGNSNQVFGMEHVHKIEKVALSQEIRSSLNQSIKFLVDGRGCRRISKILSEAYYLIS